MWIFTVKMISSKLQTLINKLDNISSENQITCLLIEFSVFHF